MAKDLTAEMYFSEDKVTTIAQIGWLANELLNTTWTFDIYRNQEPRMINLAFLGWKFEFNSRKRAAGLCSRLKKTIYISEYLLSQNLDKSIEFEDTIRHEIAHAIDFETRGKSDHGRIWKAIAKRVLCNGERCYDSNIISVKEKTKYTIICDNCKTEEPSHKTRRKVAFGLVACGTCCKKHNGGRFSKEYALRQVQNY